MSYDVYITRAPHLREGAEAPIRQEDWRFVIENDPDLSAPDQSAPHRARWGGPSSRGVTWIDWSDGNLFSTDPDHSVIRKLVQIATLLGGRVEGEGGECYTVRGGDVVRTEAASSMSAVPIAGPNASFARTPEEVLTPDVSRREPGADVPFSVGERVQTSWGRPATVISIDAHAESGSGIIEIRYDDGRSATMSCLGHGLRPL